MTSVNTNASATTALRTLQQTNKALDTTQNRISTGLKIGEAKDNAAYWAISTTLKSDNKSLSTVKDALNLGAATVDVAYQGLNKAKEVLEEIQKKLTASTAAGVDRNVIQAEVAELQKQLVSIASASTFSGENWLSVNSEAIDYASIKNVVSSFTRSADNAVEIGTVDVDISTVALFDGSTVAGKNGILDTARNLKDSTGRDLMIGGTKQTDGGNVSKLGLDTAAANAAVGGKAEAAAGANVTAAGAATASAVGTTVAGTPATAAIGKSGSLATPPAGYAAGDFLDLAVTIDGNVITIPRLSLDSTVAGAGQVTTDGSFTLANVVAKLNGTTAFSAVATAAAGTGADANKLVITTTSTNGTSSSVLVAMNVYNAATGTTASAATPTTALTTQGNIASTTGTAAGAVTKGSFTTGTLDHTKFADGDVITVKYRANGATTDATASVTLAAADVASDNALATKLAGITLTGGTATATTGTVKFEAGATIGNSFQITDITVKSTAGVIKNVDVTTGLTESKAGTALTDDVGTNWGTNFPAGTDKIKLSLTVDGATLELAPIAAGASAAAFATALNADTAFSAKATAEIVSNKLVITSKTTGATSGVTIDSVSFTDTAGAPLNKTGTGFKNTETTAIAKTADFTGSVKLDDTDNLYFNIAVNDATGSKLVTVNKELVNKALTAAAVALDPAAVPVTDGEISNVAEYKTVMEAALAASNVTGVKIAVGTGADAAKLVFTTDKAGAKASLTFSQVDASSGANQMSIEQIDISDAGFAKLGVTSSADIKAVVQAYISVVNSALKGITTAAANLGAVASRIDLQNTFVDTLMDTIDKGVSNLIDADLSEESTRLQALQTKQQLGVQALSIANSGTQNILRLFQ